MNDETHLGTSSGCSVMLVVSSMAATQPSHTHTPEEVSTLNVYTFRWTDGIEPY